MSLKHTPLLAFLLLICHRLYIYLSRYIHIYPYILIYIYIWSRVPCSHPPPHGMGGVWCPCGGVYTYIHTYIPTYLPTYLRTYIHTYHYITLPYITLPYIPYIHTYIPTYQHTTTTGHGGGGPEEPDDTVHPYPLVGGEGGWPTLHHIYIYIYPYIYSHNSIYINIFWRGSRWFPQFTIASIPVRIYLVLWSPGPRLVKVP